MFVILIVGISSSRIKTDDVEATDSIKGVTGTFSGRITGSDVQVSDSVKSVYGAFSGTTAVDSLKSTKGISIGGEIVSTNATSCNIITNTSDGADSKYISINGGGEAGNYNRGAYISVFGNEYPSLPGQISLRAGAGNGTTAGAVNVQPRLYLGTRPTNDASWTIGLGKLSSIFVADVDETYWSHNAYYYSGWKYRESDATAGANVVLNSGGTFAVSVAGDGTKDSAITWSPRLRATTTGVSIGKATNATEMLDVVGNGTFSGTLASTTLNTGNGANELHPMNQGVRTTDDVTFDSTRTRVSVFDSVKLGTGSFLNAYLDTTFTVDVYEDNTLMTTAQVKVVQIGKMIMMYVPTTTITKVGVGSDFKLASIPSKFIPSVSMYCHVMAISNNTYMTGYAEVGNPFLLGTTNDANVPVKLAPGTSGVAQSIITWIIN